MQELDESTRQDEPYGVFQGKPITTLPRDLYIPPDALEIFLEAFEGPLDLLLYLIKKQNVDILDIPVAEITRQYMQYVEMMKRIKLELAAEYLVMASMLTEIKSRILLPKPSISDDDEDDPRAELVRRLQEYERFKKAAEKIDELPRIYRNIFVASAEPPEFDINRPQPQIDIRELLLAFNGVMARSAMFSDHQIHKEVLSTRERMAQILLCLDEKSFSDFVELFDVAEGKMGVVITFSAILELIRQSIIEIVQHDTFAKIHVRRVA